MCLVPTAWRNLPSRWVRNCWFLSILMHTSIRDAGSIAFALGTFSASTRLPFKHSLVWLLVLSHRLLLWVLLLLLLFRLPLLMVQRLRSQLKRVVKVVLMTFPSKQETKVYLFPCKIISPESLSDSFRGLFHS